MILQNIRYLITQNDSRRILENVDLLINKDMISGIGRNIPEGDHKIIDCSNKAVLPGLINAHTHSSMTVLRGISDNKKLDDWLHEEIFPAEEKINPEDAYTGALTASIEMLETGTTTFNDMYDHMENVAKAVEESGIRAVLARGLLDTDDKGEERMKQAIELIGSFKDLGRIETCIAPHGVYTCSEQLLEDARESAEMFEVPYHIHVSETEKEVEESREEHGVTPLEHLNSLDAVNPKLIAAHGVHLTDKEKEILEKKGGNVVHNPSANLKLGSGIAEIPELVDRGINVAMGTDGPASNNNFNLFEEAKIASLLHKKENPERITEQQVLDMLTVNGAKALGLEERIGSIEIGKKADLITVDLENPELNPVNRENLISHLIYSFSGKVSETIVNGKLVVEQGRITTVDRQKAIQKLNESRSGL